MSSAPKLQPAILIISETASKDASTDRTSGILTDVFTSEASNAWGAPQTAIVADDVREIQAAVRRWTDVEDDAVNLIVTSGGTGFTGADVTPEVYILSRFHASLFSSCWRGLLDSSRPITNTKMLDRRP